MAHIRKRASGKYQIEVNKIDPRTGKNERFFKTIKAKNKYEAKKKAAIFEAKLEKKMFFYTNMILAEYAQRWLDKKRNDLAPKTVSNYTSKLNLHILPGLGGIKLRNLSPMNFLDLYDDLRDKKNLSGKTVNVIHKVIHSMLSDAVRWELIEYNPLNKVKAPKFKSKKNNYLTIEETKNLLYLIDHHNEKTKYKLATHLALFCGLRRGEILGLEWKDIDFKENTFRVERTSQYITGKGIITKSPKNETSSRIIYFDDNLKELFIEQREILKELSEVVPSWIETDRILASETGGPMFPDSVSKWFKRFLKRHEFPKYITFHGLRHTSATIMIYNEIDIQTIATRLGHSDATTTLKVYSHQFKKADKTAAEKISKTLK